MLIEPDDLLNAGLMRTPEVEIMLLDGRREYLHGMEKGRRPISRTRTVR